MYTEHRGRINIALAYIDTHLDSELPLEKIANVAHYSPFHFHRIFKTVTGEALNAYIIRKRIEKAASILIRRKDISISELSLQYGFNSNSSFTRTFKKYYSISPSEFRKISPSKYSKIRKVESKNGQENSIFEKYICNSINHKKWITMQAKVEIKNMPELQAAYITQIGTDGIEHSFERLLRWGRSKGLLENPEAKMVRVFHDSFKITASDKVRMSICLLTNDPFEIEEEIGKTSIEKGKHIVGRFEITSNDFKKSWSSLFVWMNENGYKKAPQNPFEIYHNDPREHPENKYIVDLLIPIY